MASTLRPLGYLIKWIENVELLETPEHARNLLEGYAGIPPEEVISHVNRVRARALETDLRQLAANGAQPSKLYGVDICGEFFDIGYELFRDKSSFGATFLQADIFESDSPLVELTNKIDIIWTASVIHLWGWKKQRAALQAMLVLLDRSPNPLLAGRFLGFSEPGEYFFESGGKPESVYRHNDVSFVKLFREASENFGGWEVEVEAPVWVETMKLKMSEEPKHPWDVQIKFMARRKGLYV
ncbi:hypothetical protein N0V90_000667 [Kalmusia sp. IMI 367209]|nr:hypothetical protein N0V90_000667 [Kalmusia sp. IMI 367209]